MTRLRSSAGGPLVRSLAATPFARCSARFGDTPPAALKRTCRHHAFGVTHWEVHEDGVGAALERWKKDELDELAPIEVDLPAEGRREGDVVPVRLHSSITEVGTLLLEAVPLAPNKPDERWKVELSVRSE